MTEPNPTNSTSPPPTGASTAPGIGANPVPIASLAYAYVEPRARRPGIITAIGVISIVVASISFLTNFVTGMQGIAFYFLSSKLASMPTPVATTPGSAPNSAGTSTNGVTSNTSVSVTPTPAPTNPLKPAQVYAAVQSIQWQSGTKPTPAQVSALNAALSNPNQELIQPGTPASTPTSGVIDGLGNAYITFPGGEVLSLNAQGQPITNPFGGNGMAPFSGLSQTACGLTALDALCSTIVAIYLFVAGILILRMSPGSRRLHLTYAIIKIPLAAAGSAAVAWMYASFYSSMMPAAMNSVAIMIGVWYTVVGWIYPISLLIALNTRHMRDYFHALSAAPRQ